MSIQRPGGGPVRAVPTLTEVLRVEQPAIDAADPIDGRSDTIIPLKPSVEAALAMELDLNLDDPVGPGTPVMMPDGSLAASFAVPEPSAAGAQAVDGSHMVERVLGDVQRRVDLMLEYRLRESLTPALARMTDTFIRDMRNELAATLRDIVSRAVEAELARERGGSRPGRQHDHE